MELGLRITDELGPSWAELADDDFLKRLELAIALTLELGEEWVAIYGYYGQTARKLTRVEITAALGLDPAVVADCLCHFEEERLIEQHGPSSRLRLPVRENLI